MKSHVSAGAPVGRTIPTERHDRAQRPESYREVRKDLVRRARTRLAAGFYDSDRCLSAAVNALLRTLDLRTRRSGRPAARSGPVRLARPVVRRGEDRVRRPDDGRSARCR